MDKNYFIELIATLVTIIASVFAGIAWVISRIHKNSFDSGKHDAEHKSISDDITMAHDRIREAESKISDLQSITQSQKTAHETLIKSQEHIQKRLDEIYKILISRSGQ